MTASGTAADTLLVLDDCAETAELIGELGRLAGFEAAITTDVDAFNFAVAQQHPSMITLDLRMPGADGVEVLRSLAARGCTAGILLISGVDTRTAVSAERFGQKANLNILGSVTKPFDPESLVARLKSLRDITGRLVPGDFCTAIHDENVTLRYQPVVRRLGPRLWHAESVEALPRWIHPDLGVVTPNQFLPTLGPARETLMRNLTDYVLQHGTAQLRQWQCSGLHLGLRVNVPAVLISDTAFPDRLAGLLGEYTVDPTLLTLELTDAMDLARSRDGVDILTRLRLKGINLSLDGLGGNMSALQSLYVLPVNEAKLDRHITADITREHGAVIVLRRLIQLVQELEIESCVVGVETSEELEFLEEFECDLIQGFYVSPPIPAMDVPKALDVWTARSESSRQNNAAP